MPYLSFDTDFAGLLHFWLAKNAKLKIDAVKHDAPTENDAKMKN
jgi:hypothetical protein